jgi:ectoine hydroxylase-related dioxygenase (phytanoyl-CoA dioxygenase family)
MPGTTVPSPSLPTIGAEQVRQFHEEGFFLLERAIPAEHLRLAREVCDQAVAGREARLAPEGAAVNDLDHPGRPYFIGDQVLEQPRIGAFLFSELMAAICRATLGDTSYLFLDQFVVKSGERRRKFAWHQDSGYIGHPHRPYLTCWCALDDVDEANGTVSILPHSRSGVRTTGVVPHLDGGEGDGKVGYHGDDPGIPVVLPAGSIAVFSSTTFHCSGSNTTSRPRRAYVVQYSAEPIRNAAGDGLWGRAEAFIHDGRRVRWA